MVFTSGQGQHTGTQSTGQAGANLPAGVATAHTVEQGGGSVVTQQAVSTSVKGNPHTSAVVTAEGSKIPVGWFIPAAVFCVVGIL